MVTYVGSGILGLCVVLMAWYLGGIGLYSTLE
jgi:hypothetical protein